MRLNRRMTALSIVVLAGGAFLATQAFGRPGAKPQVQPPAAKASQAKEQAGGCCPAMAGGAEKADPQAKPAQAGSGGCPMMAGGKGMAGAHMAAKPGKTQYGCPIHPAVKSNRPGKCPKCGMALVAVKAAGSAAAKGSCPMMAGKAAAKASPKTGTPASAK